MVVLHGEDSSLKSWETYLFKTQSVLLLSIKIPHSDIVIMVALPLRPSLPEEPLGERRNKANLDKESDHGLSSRKHHQGIMQRSHCSQPWKEAAPVKRGQAIHQRIWKQGMAMDLQEH